MDFVKGQVNLDEDILVVDKPVGWTSHDVVAKIRGEVGKHETRSTKLETKIGHGGTLDPFATGVLLILVGKATRRFEEIKTWDKEYVMTVKLGAATTTGDPEGEVTETRPVTGVKRERVERALRDLTGFYQQQVPAYSAVKVGGERLYALAREGKEVKLPRRQVEIKEIELVDLQGLSLKVRVVCGSGTYMRQLAVDIGEKLDLPAHAAALRRTRVGDYELS